MKGLATTGSPMNVQGADRSPRGPGAIRCLRHGGPGLVGLCLVLLLVACQSPSGAFPPATAAGSGPPPPALPSPPPTATAEARPTLDPTPTPDQPVPTRRYGYRVLNRYPHDPAAFTQGLVYHDGWLYEGTGLVGQSSLRRVNLVDGRVEQLVMLPETVFGEGIAVLDDRIFQLTWTSQIGYIYDRASFSLLGSFAYTTEGWGLTTDGERLIMSDGSARLTFRDPASLDETGQVLVTDAGVPLERLNELEFVEGQVWANVWQTDRIARIDPDTGRVAGWIDLTGLLDLSRVRGPVDVLNGIAFDPEAKRLFVTGKWWPELYEIEVIPLD